MTCTHDCDCILTATRGMEVDGIGTPDDPYDLHPQLGYQLSVVAESFATLPTLTEDDIGTFGWVKNTNSAYTWWGVGTQWRPFGPQWRQCFPSDLQLLTLFGAGRDVADASLSLSPGAWACFANGVLDADITALGAGPTAGRVSMTAMLQDMTHDLLIDQTQVQVLDATWPDNFGSVVHIPINLQGFWTVNEDTEVTVIQNYYTGSASASWLRSIDIAAIQLAHHNFTT